MSSKKQKQWKLKYLENQERVKEKKNNEQTREALGRMIGMNEVFFRLASSQRI